jgi:hypothetical protein
METEAFTYPQLAERLGIGPESVRKQVSRKRWRKVRGNDGTTLIFVPVSELGAPPPPRPSPASAPNPVQTQIARLQAELGTARAVIQRADGARITAEADRDRWHAEAEALRAQLAAELAKPLLKRIFG